MYVDPALVYWLSLVCSFSLGVIVGVVGLTLLAFISQRNVAKRRIRMAENEKARQAQRPRDV